MMEEVEEFMFGRELNGGNDMEKKIFSIYKWVVKHLSTNSKRRLRSFKFFDKQNLFLRAKFKPDFIITKKEKHKIFLDANDSLHLSVHESFEDLESEIMRKNVREGDLVLDIGANIGYYSLLLAKLVGGNGKVYSFEPEPSNFALLKKNIEVNGYKNIIPIQKAVSESNRKIKFYLEKENFGAHKIHNSNKKMNSIEVDSVKLDSFFKNKKQKINFIKMDIEGAEGKAIQGMQNLIKTNKNLKIILEFTPVSLRECGVGPEELFKMLKEFKSYNIDEHKNKINLVNPKQITSDFNGGGFTNLLFIRK